MDVVKSMIDRVICFSYNKDMMYNINIPVYEMKNTHVLLFLHCHYIYVITVVYIITIPYICC